MIYIYIDYICTLWYIYRLYMALYPNCMWVVCHFLGPAPPSTRISRCEQWKLWRPERSPSHHRFPCPKRSSLDDFGVPSFQETSIDPLHVIWQFAITNQHFFIGFVGCRVILYTVYTYIYNIYKQTIFHSYVRMPEGMPCKIGHIVKTCQYRDWSVHWLS